MKSYLVLGLGVSGNATMEWLKKNKLNAFSFDDTRPADYNDVEDVPWNDIVFVVASPGLLNFANPHVVICRANALGIAIITDINLLIDNTPNAKFIGVTGTNGKSTTVTLIHHVLKKYYNCILAGNIGTPALSVENMENGIYVLELSSFQLAFSQNLKLDVAALINLTSDHIQNHGTFSNYINDKKKIFNCAKNSVIANDEYCQKIANSLGRDVNISRVGNSEERVTSIDHDYEIYAKENCLYYNGQVILNFDETILKGSHNHQNACVAFGVCKLFLELKFIVEQFKTFKGLAHRQEIVEHQIKCVQTTTSIQSNRAFEKYINNLLIINDSKATNAKAASVAIEAYKNYDIYWILGGQPKSEGIDCIKDSFIHIKWAFIIGQAQEEFAKSFDGIVPYTSSGDLKTALNDALKIIALQKPPKPLILFSPACASFDQFTNFEQRGNIFKELVISYNSTKL